MRSVCEGRVEGVCRAWAGHDGQHVRPLGGSRAGCSAGCRAGARPAEAQLQLEEVCEEGVPEDGEHGVEED